MKKHEAIKFAYDNYPKGTIFKWNNGFNTVSTGNFEVNQFNNGIQLKRHPDDIDYLVFDGLNWAEIVPKNQVFILKSQDGVSLYSGMEFYGASFNKSLDRWRLDTFKGKAFVLNKDSLNLRKNKNFPYITYPDISKAFSTKEAAIKWIEENNKTKKPDSIFLFNDTEIPVIVFKDCIHLKTSNAIGNNRDVRITKDELIEINKHFNSLQD